MEAGVGAASWKVRGCENARNISLIRFWQEAKSWDWVTVYAMGTKVAAHNPRSAVSEVPILNIVSPSGSQSTLVQYG